MQMRLSIDTVCERFEIGALLAGHVDKPVELVAPLAMPAEGVGQFFASTSAVSLSSSATIRIAQMIASRSRR